MSVEPVSLMRPGVLWRSPAGSSGCLPNHGMRRRRHTSGGRDLSELVPKSWTRKCDVETTAEATVWRLGRPRPVHRRTPSGQCGRASMSSTTRRSPSRLPGWAEMTWVPKRTGRLTRGSVASGGTHCRRRGLHRFSSPAPRRSPWPGRSRRGDDHRFNPARHGRGLDGRCAAWMCRVH